MNKKTLMMVITLGILANFAHAEETSLANQLAVAKATLQQEQTLNAELREKLAENEKLIAELKQRAQSLDEQITAIREEHGITDDA